MVVYISVNLDNGDFIFGFDEPVEGLTADPTAVQLLWSANFYYLFNFTQGSVTVINSTSFAITIDADSLLSLLDAALGRPCDYVLFDSNLVSDIFNNRVVASQRRADVFIPDMTGPILLSFDLDMNVGAMNITFSEAILQETFDSSGITVQDAPTANYQYTLSPNSTSSPTGLRSLFVALTTEDLNGIKAAQDTATINTNTYMTVSSAVITDPFNNPARVSSAVQVSSFTPDSVNPELVSFSFGPWMDKSPSRSPSLK